MEVKLIPSKGLDVGVGKNEIYTTQVYGGIVGIILDGRGRQPFLLPQNAEDRVENLAIWSDAINEYPTRGSI